MVSRMNTAVAQVSAMAGTRPKAMTIDNRPNGLIKARAAKAIININW